MTGWHWVNVDSHRLRVRHYFQGGVALCGKVQMDVDPPFRDVRDSDVFNCRACRNRLERLRRIEDEDAAGDEDESDRAYTYTGPMVEALEEEGDF